MTFEQEPIKIEIPVEEEEVVYVSEGQARDLSQRLEEGARKTAARAREVWESEQRRQVKRVATKSARRGVRASRRGLARGLEWLSRCMAGLAERFTPVE